MSWSWSGGEGRGEGGVPPALVLAGMGQGALAPYWGTPSTPPPLPAEEDLGSEAGEGTQDQRLESPSPFVD